DDTIAAMYRAIRDFFAQPLDAKAALRADPIDPLARGFSSGSSPAGGDVPGAPPDELFEAFGANRLGEPEVSRTLPAGVDPRLLVANKWPVLPDFRAAYLAYYGAVERLAMAVMRLFALALNLPEHWFDDKFDQHMTSLA